MAPLKKILITCDKYKGSLTASQVCDAIEKAISQKYPLHSCIKIPMADGGDGTLGVLKTTQNLHELRCQVQDPLGRIISAKYLSDNHMAYIELAEASGIVRLMQHELNIMNANTIGTGQLVKHALEMGHEEIVLTIGGSCSHDLGLGVAYELGYRFIDHYGKAMIPCGTNLLQIKSIQSPKKQILSKFKILCDVDNPLYGPDGAAQIFGPQKGANADDIKILDQGSIYLAKLIKRNFNKEIGHFKGAGAAGGVAAGLYGLLYSVELINGFDFLSEKLNLAERIKEADLVISGEGKLDRQSMGAKVVGKMAKLCKEYQKPLILIVGKNELPKEMTSSLGIKHIFSLDNLAKNEQDSISNAAKYLAQIDLKDFI